MGITALLSQFRGVFDSTYADSVLASGRVLTFATPLLLQVWTGELQLPYEIVPKGKPQTHDYPLKLVRTNGLPHLQHYDWGHSTTITEGSFVLREASVFEAADVRLRHSALELAYHTKIARCGYLPKDETIDGIVQFAVEGQGFVLTNVLAHKVTDYFRPGSQPEDEILTYPSIRLGILKQMVPLLEEARNLSLTPSVQTRE